MNANQEITMFMEKLSCVYGMKPQRTDAASVHRVRMDDAAEFLRQMSVLYGMKLH